MNSVIIFLFDGVLLFALAWWFSRKQAQELRVIWWTAFSWKAFCAVAVGWVYFFHYGQGDIISYWNDGSIVAHAILNDPADAWQFFWNDDPDQNNIQGLISNRPRSLFFIKIAGVLMVLAHGNFWMMSLILAFISFLASWYLFKKVIELFPSATIVASISFLFYPSVIFWSSGIVKETVALSGLFFLSGMLLKNFRGAKISIPEWILGLISIWMCWNLKYYWIGIFLPVALTTFMVVIILRKFRALEKHEMILWGLIFIILIAVATNIHPNFYPSRFLEVICQNNADFMQTTDTRFAVNYDNLQPTLISFLSNSPRALVAGLFRPFVWEGHNLLFLIAGIENFFLLVFTVLALLSLRKINHSPYKMLCLASIVYILLLAIFLALSTPNLGTLSRYKVGFLPFLVFVSLKNNPVFFKVIGFFRRFGR